MSRIDLNAYFRRVGYSGPATATLDALQMLCRLHPAAIAFENLDPLMKRPVKLDIEALADKLIHRGRGGYCYEQNTLFEAVLRALGFSVETLAARVQWNVPPGKVGPRYHMVLRIDLPGGVYIADAGFGGLTLTAPLRLMADIEQPTPHGLHRFVRIGDEFQLQAKLGENWVSVFLLSLQTEAPADWEVANWYTSTNPNSVFTHSLMAACPVGDRRLGLVNNDLRIHYPDGRTDRRILKTSDELASVLRNDFRIDLPDGCAAAFDRIIAGA
jgi:N-hydroxyarylamine O-acetyltransferase